MLELTTSGHAIGSVAAGFVLLFLSGNFFVQGSSALASRLGIPPLVIGLTVVAFGTSAPELMVSIDAALSGHAEIAVGNVVGSNTFNVAFVAGLAALVLPLAVSRRLIRIDTPIMIGVSLAGFVLLLDGAFGRWEGVVFLVALVVYAVMNIRMAQTDGQSVCEPATALSRPLWITLLVLTFGLAGLVAGADLLVDGSVFFARTWGVSEAVIGITIVAVGTSLPEIATSIVAAVRRQPDIAVGNIVGSNVFNLLGILGVTAVIRPIGHAGIGVADLGMMLGTALVLLPLMKSGARIGRREGALLLGLYGVYLWYIWP